MRTLLLLPVLLALLLQPLLPGAADRDAGRLGQDLVERLVNGQEPAVEQYRALRMLWGRNDRMDADAWMEVWTDLDPLEGFRYEVVAEGGSAQIRRRGLVRLLESEGRAIEEGDFERAAFTIANYEFEPDEFIGDELRVTMTPRRKDSLLLSGVLFLSVKDGDLVRVEGRPARLPSFWTRRVDLVRRYERLAGVRVPVQIDSVAHVRFVGPSELRMTFAYESINGVRVGAPAAQGLGLTIGAEPGRP